MRVALAGRVVLAILLVSAAGVAWAFGYGVTSIAFSDHPDGAPATYLLFGSACLLFATTAAVGGLALAAGNPAGRRHLFAGFAVALMASGYPYGEPYPVLGHVVTAVLLGTATGFAVATFRRRAVTRGTGG